MVPRITSPAAKKKTDNNKRTRIRKESCRAARKQCASNKNRQRMPQMFDDTDWQTMKDYIVEQAIALL